MALGLPKEASPCSGLHFTSSSNLWHPRGAFSLSVLSYLLINPLHLLIASSLGLPTLYSYYWYPFGAFYDDFIPLSLLHSSIPLVFFSLPRPPFWSWPYSFSLMVEVMVILALPLPHGFFVTLPDMTSCTLGSSFLKPLIRKLSTQLLSLTALTDALHFHHRPIVLFCDSQVVVSHFTQV